MEQQTLTLSEKINVVEESLNEFEAKHKIPRPNVSKDLVEKYMNQQNVSSLTLDECGEAALILSQYSYYIQTVINKEKALIRWTNYSIEQVVTRDIDKYIGYKYEERLSKAIVNNDYASKVNKLKVNAEIKVERLQFLASKIDSIAKIYIELSQTKRRKNYD